MIALLTLLGVGVLAVALQAAIQETCRLGVLFPNLVFLLVSYVALFGTRGRARLLAVTSGFFLDAASQDPWGANIVSLIILAQLLIAAADDGWADRPVSCALLVAITVPVTFVCRWTLVWLLQGVFLSWTHEVSIALYTLLFCWPFFSLLDCWNRLLTGVRQSRP